MAKPRMGRPSKYKPEYCEALLAGAKAGQTIEMFCDAIGVHKDTFYEWCKHHKELSDSWKRARQSSEAYWQKIGMAGMTGKIPGFNASIWIFWMKARHAYRDDQAIFEEESDLEFV